MKSNVPFDGYIANTIYGATLLLLEGHDGVGINELRKTYCNIFEQIGNELEKQKNQWILMLSNVETSKTAIDEIEKSIRLLRSYNEELPYLVNRNPIGLFYVSLPFNNPIYSFLLYCCGIALGGNKVIARPSKMTTHYVESFYSAFLAYFELLNISIYTGSGKSFIDMACNQNNCGGLLFTGSYENLQSIESHFPPHMSLIYCGQGINPFVVGPDLTDICSIVNIAINSRIYNSGQDCLCSEKFIIHETMFDMFVAELTKQLDCLTIGETGDVLADVIPPVKGMEDFALNRYNLVASEGQLLYERRDKGVTIAVFEVPIDGVALNSEKFCPIFTLSRYSSDDELRNLANSDYQFGAILTGNCDKELWAKYPHVVCDQTVMEVEAESLHQPFGGRHKSGFSKRNDSYRDGPILFSVESTIG